MPQLERPSGYRYTREGVERALAHHFGSAKLPRLSPWKPNGKGGYFVSTGVGVFELKTLREAVLFVVAMAEKERLMLKVENAA